MEVAVLACCWEKTVERREGRKGGEGRRREGKEAVEGREKLQVHCKMFRP